MINIKINNTPINISTNTKDVTFKVFFKIPETFTSECFGDNRIITTTPVIVGSSGNLNLTNITSPTVNYTTNDQLDTWLDVSMTIDEASTIGNIDIFLELNGTSDCQCDYEVLVKDVDILETVEHINVIQIPKIGFNTNTLGDEVVDGVQRVIDNKKSWVYNPGRVKNAVKDFDKITRSNGDFGLMENHGNINRTFAPSPDANLLYRKTNYLEQSSTEERHSDLVINSKELFLNFNMTPIQTGGTTTIVGLLNLEEYKKTFQSFWIKIVEQFVPATTIFVSSERWANDPNDICTEASDCDYDMVLTSGDTSAAPQNMTIARGFSESDTEQNRACVACGGTAEEILSKEILGNTDLIYTASTRDNSTDSTIYFEALTVITLEENRRDSVITSEPLVIENREQKISDMNNYYSGGRNNRTIETVVV